MYVYIYIYIYIYILTLYNTAAMLQYQINHSFIQVMTKAILLGFLRHGANVYGCVISSYLKIFQGLNNSTTSRHRSDHCNTVH